MGGEDVDGGLPGGGGGEEREPEGRIVGEGWWDEVGGCGELLRALRVDGKY